MAAAARPSSWRGTRTVVSVGVTRLAYGTSSQPTTEEIARDADAAFGARLQDADGHRVVVTDHGGRRRVEREQAQTGSMPAFDRDALADDQRRRRRQIAATKRSRVPVFAAGKGRLVTRRHDERDAAVPEAGEVLDDL